MIKLIVGSKGSGKTKTVIDMINNAAKTSNGNVVVIEKSMALTYNIDHSARLIDLSEYDIKGEALFTGFLNGILASNFDVSLIFIDAFLHLVDCDKPDIYKLEGFFQMLERLSEHSQANFVISLSEDPALVPECIRKYQI